MSSTLRLAARLCFAWGIEDVFGWMEKVDPRVLEFWQAFDFVEPIGEQWRQTAETNQLLSRVVELFAAKLGVQLEPTTIDELMPPRYMRETKPKRKSAPKTAPVVAFDSLLTMCGFSEVVDGRNDKSS